MLPSIIRLLNPILLMVLLLLVIVAFRFVWLDFRKPIAKKKPKKGAIPEAAGLRDLVQSGQLEEAVTVYQKFTGTDRFTARKAIDDMAREIRLSDSVKKDIYRLLNRNKKAAAIEAYQQATGADLAEALTYVESLQAERA